MIAQFKKYELIFKQPAGTSRGVLRFKETYFIKITNGQQWGIGECGLFRGLSVDDLPDYQEKLAWACQNIALGLEVLYAKLTNYPSIQIGLEMAFNGLYNNSPFRVFPSKFTQKEAPIAINGLIWMGDKDFMNTQVKAKIEAGFTCIKMKIGAIDFNSELDVLKQIRQEFSAGDITLRVDANGAFTATEALGKLAKLAQLDIHSIEQPIQPGQWDAMAKLCRNTPLPIALDEELIGIHTTAEREALLDAINPQYIILKPTLVGGFKGSDNWINIAEKKSINWWITSALESNIGLNAICQYTYTKNTILPQGLGTGGLFTNNLNAPLQIENGAIVYKQNKPWDITQINTMFND